jgi:hypothetical protein
MARLRCLAALALRTKAEQTIDMAKKRTKSDKAQRQAEGLEKKRSDPVTANMFSPRSINP